MKDQWGNEIEVSQSPDGESWVFTRSLPDNSLSISYSNEVSQEECSIKALNSFNGQEPYIGTDDNQNPGALL